MRIAAEPWEFDAIHRLNYQTFVEEIPQHPTHPSGRLVATVMIRCEWSKSIIFLSAVESIPSSVVTYSRLGTPYCAVSETPT